MTAVLAVALAGLGVAAALVLVRLWRGPDAADRVVASDTMLLYLTTAVALIVGLTGATRFAPVILVSCLVGFVGTLATARFLERPRRREGRDA